MCSNQNIRRMKTTLLVVGRTVEQHYITAINDYIQRTKRFITFDMEVIPELKNTKSLSMEQQKEKEGELILKALQPGDVIVLLDEHGKEMRSLEFADYMKRKMNTVNKRLVFIIGGPYGFSEKVYQVANEKISMSKMTFSHQMIRLIFVEQIYRAMTILNGGPSSIDTNRTTLTFRSSPRSTRERPYASFSKREIRPIARTCEPAPSSRSHDSRT